MSNHILSRGLVTPFVIFNFATGSIEATEIPRYFVSLEHNRTCKEACTFKLTITYIPDTFSPGRPTVIDNMLITSCKQKVTYQYGYFDYMGVRHVQNRMYVGQMNTYGCDVDIASGKITYTVEGTSTIVELITDIVRIDAVDHPKKPSTHLVYLTSGTMQPGFRKLYDAYDLDIDHTDHSVHIPNLGEGTVFDLIMGTVTATKKNDGTFSRSGGLVALSNAKPFFVGKDSVYSLYNSGEISQEEYRTFVRAYDMQQHSGYSGEALKDANEIVSKFDKRLTTPFICYFDDDEHSGKPYGTFHYVPSKGWETDDVFEYYYGNNVPNSDVLSLSFSFDPSVGLATAVATSSVVSSIDANGNNIGNSNAVTQLGNLGRNTYPTLSGFNEDAFISQSKLSELMIYSSYSATMTIMGQLRPNNLLDIIYLVVYVNGTEHPTLSGHYKVMGIIDNVSSSGFTTQLQLIRELSNTENMSTMETYITSPTDGKAGQVQNSIDSTSTSTTSYTSTSIPNR